MKQPLQSHRKRRLGEILRDAGLINDLQLNAALSEQRKWGGKLGRTLVEMGFVDEQSMTVALSRQLQIPLVDLDNHPVAPDAVQFLRVDIAERYGVFPVAGDRQARTVTIATSDPTNVEQLQELAFHTGLRVQLAVATGSSIDRALRRYYYGENVVASDAATPRKLGLSEPEYDADELSDPKATPLNGTADSRMAQSSPELVSQMLELNQRMVALEKLVSGQVRALRGIVELLLEKGVVTREEYLAKVRGRDGGTN